MKIGQLLITAGLIDEKQLEIALSEQAKTGAKLGQILADLGFTTEDAVSRALAQQSGVAHIDADEADIEAAAIELVPEATARKLNALPLRIEGKTLLVAMSNPTDIISIDELQRAGGAVRPGRLDGAPPAPARPRPRLRRPGQSGLGARARDPARQRRGL